MGSLFRSEITKARVSLTKRGISYQGLSDEQCLKLFKDNKINYCSNGCGSIIKTPDGSHMCRSCWRKTRDINVSKRPEVREKISRKLSGRVFTDEWKQKLSTSAKIVARNRWDNNTNNVREKINSAGVSRPNKEEIRILNVLNSLFEQDFKYVGNGSYFIDGYNPDFINKNEDRIIEFFGNYWHANPSMFGKEQVVMGRLVAKNIWKKDFDKINHFVSKGFKVCVVWGTELKNINKLKAKLRDFNNHICHVSQ